MKETFLTRNDEGIGEGIFDSIAWAYETHVKRADNPRAGFAVLYGNEDSPDRIDFFDVNDCYTDPIETWKGDTCE
jgi:hypothetical protein